ncbi:response regulator [Deinococcus peraridilitoris]|uniref:Response regulator with CheY-like receiver, AAA-type ATPase, and DNA-binding domains n=1 Tax=Deinococcus peraridilitoris (strain DSM 19664 / LMG 22246 / CIP 109416 / KR-200) TaxID=937777 RepID=K9ZYW0_DEIPD|nr:response regulator [Deinococcus peraridilitoris]AFZ65945.1 response regulator with CheY-like receiver, AAA-type ATPase, and DNA-binding domains [Deinococcus peraridilitoris DSM 19664]
MTNAKRNALRLLLVDDSEADVLLTRLAFEELDVPHELQVAQDGVEALNLLRSGTQALPDLILLDLNMPRMGGLEVLLELKANPAWRNVPVIVLTTSAAASDVWESYQRYANAYIRKPASLPDFVESLRRLHLFWQTVALFAPDEPDLGRR